MKKALLLLILGLLFGCGGSNSEGEAPDSLAPIPPGEFSVTVVDEDTGDPISGAYVVLHSADGSVEQFGQTDSSGQVLFGVLERQTVTVTILDDPDDEEVSLVTFYEVPRVSFTYRGDVEEDPFNNEDPVAEISVDVDTPGLDPDLYELWLEPWNSGSFPVGDGDIDSLDVDSDKIQIDGKISFLAEIEEDREEGDKTVRYGCLLDQTLKDGETYHITANSEPQEVPVTTNHSVPFAGISAFRRGLEYDLSSEFFESGADSFNLVIPSCLQPDFYVAGASWLIETLILGGLTDLENLRFDLPDYPDLKTLNYDSSGGSIQWEVDADFQIDLFFIELTNEDEGADEEEDFIGWAFFVDSGRGSLQLPQLPQEIAEKMGDFGLLKEDGALVLSFDSLNGFAEAFKVYAEQGFDFISTEPKTYLALLFGSEEITDEFEVDENSSSLKKQSALRRTQGILGILG